MLGCEVQLRWVGRYRWLGCEVHTGLIETNAVELCTLACWDRCSYVHTERLLCHEPYYFLLVVAGVVYSMQRASAGTNQRMYFDVEPCGRHLATGMSGDRVVVGKVKQQQVDCCS